jgi:carboxypeptidase C (cathepsin A)
MVNAHFYDFLVNFFSVHDSFVAAGSGDNKRKTRPVYFAGESHAGHYIPNMISHILSKNREYEQADTASGGGIYIDVQGAAMGDPWMDPQNQYDATELAHSLGLISQGQENYLDELRGKCRQALKAGKLNVKECYALLDDVVDSSSVAGMPKVLMYDARQYVHSTSSFPPGHQDLEKYVPPPFLRG